MNHAADTRAEAKEAALLRRCRDGNREAVHIVLSREASYLERVLIRLMGPCADVEDVLQDTLTAAASALAGFRGEASVRTWMTRIAVRTAKRHLRSPHRRRARNHLELATVDGAAVQSQRSTNATTDARKALERAYEHIQRLDVNKRVAFTLHVIEGLPMREVAALTSASVAATKSRVFFARRALLSRLRTDRVLFEYFASGDEGGAA